MGHGFFLFCALAALVLALILIWIDRFNAACNRHVDTSWSGKMAELHAANTRLGATITRLEALNARAMRAELKADRPIIGLPVKSASDPKRSSPPAQRKKAPGKR